MIEPGDDIVLGVSGGADSVCLLFLLMQLSTECELILHVVHIDHGIRKTAKRDSEYVRRLCEDNRIDFSLVESDVPALAAKWHCGEEEAGRRVRYLSFEKRADEISLQRKQAGKPDRPVKIAVAHTADDQAETVLYHLFRGSASRGLAGMPEATERIIRPLLTVRRFEIEEYLRQNGIAWQEDETNAEDCYARNRIRHRIIPEAENICGGATDHIAFVAESVRETEQYMDEVVNELFKELVSEMNADGEICFTFRAEDVLRRPPAIRTRLFHKLLSRAAGAERDLGCVHIKALEDFCRSGRNTIIDTFGGVKAEMSYGMVSVGTKLPSKVKATAPVYEMNMRELTPEEYMRITEDALNVSELTNGSYTMWFDYDKIESEPVLRTRTQGDYLILKDGTGETIHQTLKSYMINKKIPAAERDSIPVVAVGNCCIWLVGYRRGEYGAITEQTTKVLEIRVGKI